MPCIRLRFLAENPALRSLAEITSLHRPFTRSNERFGSKTPPASSPRARRAMVPGVQDPIERLHDAEDRADSLPSAAQGRRGGGGKGMRL